MPHPAPLALGELAALVEGRLVGDPSLPIEGVAPLAGAGPRHIALLAAARYRGEVPASRAGALLVSASLAAGLPDGRPHVVVPDAHAALIPLLARLHPEPAPRPGIHPTAVVEPGATVGAGVEVGPYAVLGAGCVLGEGVRIGAHAVVGQGARVGAGSRVHPHVTLYPGVVVGERVILHSGTRVGSDGFGFVPSAGGLRKVPQVGGCVIEDDVEIGANCTIDRGSIGDTVIGRGSKLDNLVHVAHNVRLGPSCILTGQTGIAGSTTLGAGVVLAGQSGISGHLSIGDGVRIGAKSAVLQDVPAGATVIGAPASDHRAMMRAFALFPRLPELFRRLRALEGGGRRPGAAAEGADEGGPG